MNKKLYWIGYSTLHFALGVCYATVKPELRQALRLFAKTKRYPQYSFEGLDVRRFSDRNIALMTLYCLLTRSQVWSSGISPNTTSKLELFCLRLLWKAKKLFFYDDGLAGSISDTYVWLHTRSILPQSAGSVTWDYGHHSKEFVNAPIKMPIHLLRQLSHSNPLAERLAGEARARKSVIFVESAACDHKRLLAAFERAVAEGSHAFYFPHSGKSSVSSHFSEPRNQVIGKPTTIPITVPNNVGSLEACLIAMLEASDSTALYCGCTSTVILLLAYLKSEQPNYDLTVFMAPNYETTIPEKLHQCQEFYTLIDNEYARHFSITML